MARFVVESISAKDFLSYCQKQTVLLGGRGPVAVVGPNGAGKSTIVSKALAWGLGGVCSPERMGSGTRSLKGKGVVRQRIDPEHFTTPEATEAQVEIVLSGGGKQYQITRTRKRSKSDVIQVTCDGVDLGTDQATIDNLIGVDHDIFTKTVLRGQNDPWNFAEATDAKKRDILDAISGADKLEITFERATAMRKTRTQEVETYRARAEDAERRAAAQDVEGLDRQVAHWAGGQGTKVAAIRAELDTINVRLAQAKTADDQIAHAQAQRAQLEAQRPTLDSKPYDEAINKAVGVYMSTKGEFDRLEAEFKPYAHLEPGQACPTCQQIVGQGTHVDHIRKKYEAEFPARQNTVSKTHQHWVECQQAKADAEIWLKKAEAEWSAKMTALPAATATPQLPVVEAERNQVRKRLEETEGAQNPFKAALEQAHNAKQSLEREAVVFREEEICAENERRIAQAWEEVLHPKGVRARLAEAMLAAIESEANRWLTVLSNGRMQVRFPATKTTGRGTVKEEIQTIVLINGKSLDFLNFSGGERRRVNLAVDLGVAAVFSKGSGLALSLLVLDEEVVSGLDVDGKTAVLTALHSAGVADVVVIDHDPTLSGALPRTIVAKRGSDGYSRVQEIT